MRMPTPHAARRLRSLAALALLAPALAGCVSFGPKPPKNLLALTPQPTAAGPARSTDSAHALGLGTPIAPQALATQRVLVRSGANTLAYLADASWVAPPASLFRDLLAETVTTRTGRIVPSIRQTQIQPDQRLTGTLVEFGLDSGSGQAVVTFDAILQKSGSETIQSRRFSARVPVSSEQPVPVAAAISQAAAQVAGEIADWVGPG